MEAVDGGHHAVGVVAEHAVDTGVDQLVEDPVELGVPPEGVALEPVHEGDEATAPIAVVQVQGVDACVAERGDPPFRTLLDPAESGGVDQLEGGGEVAPGGDDLPVGVTDPQSVLGPRVAGHRHHMGDGLRVLDVERQVERRPHVA